MLFEHDHVFLLLKIMLSTVMTLAMMASITTFKYTKRRVIFCFGIYLAYVLSSSIFLVLNFPWMVFLRVFILTITLPAVILVYLLAKDSVTQTIFNYATQVNLFILLAVTATLLNTALHGNQVTDLIIRFALFSAATVLEFKFLRHSFCRLTYSLRNNWLPMALIPVSFCALLLLCGLFPVHYTECVWSVIQIYAIFGVMVIVYLVIGGSLLKSYRQLEIKLETDVMNAQLYAPIQYVEKLLESRHALREIHLGIAKADELLDTNSTDHARKILRALMPELSALDREPVCANPYLNEVLTYYSVIFQENHIPFTINIDLGDVMLPEAEVCLIINNALKNALEASLKLPKTERTVRLQAMPRQRQLLMRISNSFNGILILQNGLPRSGKQEQGYGYGLTSIRAAAVSAGGDMVFHVKDKTTFILDARVRAVSAKEESFSKLNH